MRLSCPNCDAQYEVDDAAIPLAGRDVQCSNCGYGWFQAHPSAEAEAAAMEVYDPPEPPLAGEPELIEEPEIAATPEPPPQAGELPRRRALDESVLAVLREEAEREAQVRSREQPRGIETQPDLGLPPPDTGPARRMAEAKVMAAAPATPPAADAVVAAVAQTVAAHAVEERAHSRRELLPDIEEINSSLRPSTERRVAEGDETAEDMVVERRGFRSGFMLMLIVAGLLAATYAMAPRIATQIPASAGAMQSYVGAVDRARVQIDAALKSATQTLKSLGGEEG